MANHLRYMSLLIASILILTSSCVSKKKINYFQDKDTTDTTLVKSNYSSYTPVLQKDDYLSISVNSMDLESIKPFILDQGLSTNSQVPSYSSGTAASNGYLIDSNGDIDFPVIGKIKIAGLNRMEATELIKNKLVAYVSNPTVNIRIQNFKVTVLGDVAKPGSYNIPNERISLIEAIGIAGDLNITGVRQTVLVIRDVDGAKKEYRVDLSSKDIFSSPVYYLTQNDVVYVEPNRAKRNSSLISSTAGVFISIASLVITTITLITR
jgi:polysaccharide export outer membrane protein